MSYDYIIVGSGFFGSICAYELTKKGYNLFLEKYSFEAYYDQMGFILNQINEYE